MKVIVYWIPACACLFYTILELGDKENKKTNPCHRGHREKLRHLR
jgi:hypothetical protein